MEPEGEAGAKGKMEVVGVPGNPIVSVCDVGICVMPSPVHKLDRADVVGCVNQHNQQPNCPTQKTILFSCLKNFSLL